MPLLLASLLALLLGAAPAVPYRGAAQFSLGIRGTTVAFVEHADGTLALRVADTIGSTTCALPDRAAATAVRNLLVDIDEGWFRAPNLAFTPVTPAAAHKLLPVCELRAYTLGHRVFLEAARMDAGVRTDLVTAELSPIRASHTVVDRSVVQRAEDNADAVRLVQVAAGLAAGAGAVDAAARGKRNEGLERTAALFAAGAAASGDIEDTATRYLRVIEAHTDLALSIIVLDTWLYGGHLPRNEDIEAAYRLRDLLDEPAPALLCRILARLAAGQSATDILTATRGCADGRAAIECLP